MFGEILYENFIFDIPKMFDLCVLYHPGNTPLLAKMVENIFTQQPNYNDDLVQTVHTLSQVGEVTETRIHLHNTIRYDYLVLIKLVFTLVAMKR